MRGLRIVRTMVLAAALLGVLPQLARADESSVPEQIVDSFNQLFGKQTDNRANHAKGIVVEGSFAPSAAGAQLSSAALFQRRPDPGHGALLRCHRPARDPRRRPQRQPARHGGAVHLPDGSEMDIVANSLAFFPVATGRGLPATCCRRWRRAARTPRSRPPVERFVAAHPAVRRRPPASRRRPASRARPITASTPSCSSTPPASASRSASRSRPVDGAEHLTAADAAKQAPDFLIDELGPGWPRGRPSSASWPSWREPGDPDDRCDQALARRPQAGRSRHDHGRPRSRPTAPPRRGSCCSCRPTSSTASSPRTTR